MNKVMIYMVLTLYVLLQVLGVLYLLAGLTIDGYTRLMWTVYILQFFFSTIFCIDWIVTLKSKE